VRTATSFERFIRDRERTLYLILSFHYSRIRAACVVCAVVTAGSTVVVRIASVRFAVVIKEGDSVVVDNSNNDKKSQ